MPKENNLHTATPSKTAKKTNVNENNDVTMQ